MGFLVVNSMTAEKVDVAGSEGDDCSGQDAGVQGEEAGKGVVAVVVATDDDLFEPFADQWGTGHDVGSHAGGPVAFLVPRQQVAGE